MTSFSIVLLVLFIPSYFSSSHQIQIDKYPIWFFIIIFCFLSFYRQNLFCVVCFFLLIIYFWWDFFNYLFFCSKNLGLGRKQNGHYTWVCTQSRPWQTGLDCRYCIPSSCYCADADPLKKKAPTQLCISISIAHNPLQPPHLQPLFNRSHSHAQSDRIVLSSLHSRDLPLQPLIAHLFSALPSLRQDPLLLLSIEFPTNPPSLHRSLFIT